MPPWDADPYLLKSRLLRRCFQRKILPSPLPLRPGFLPISSRATLCWDLLKSRSIRGFRTHVSAHKSNNTCATALKNNPETFGSAPSRLKIRVIRVQLFLAFLRLTDTTF